MTALRIGTRGSDLARWQTDSVVHALRARDPGIAIEIIEIHTVGDVRADVPLEELEGVGFFSSALESALRERRIDVAVHSHKDLPTVEAEGLVIAAVPERGPIEDVLCAAESATLERLRPGARIGTSSLRRIAQLRGLRRDLVFPPLRGNVPTRIRRVQEGELDGIVLARAGLERLGLMEHASQVFSWSAILPAPAQGALAIQARSGDSTVLERLRGLDHAPTRLTVHAERVLLATLGGGCSVPVGAYARLEADQIVLEAGVFDLEGTRSLRVHARHADPTAAAHEAARQLLAMGATDVLARLRRPAPLAAPRTP